MTPPRRHWRSYGNDPLPAPAEALREPFSAFPSRIEWDRCGKVQMVNESQAKWRERALRDILARMRHDGCGGLAAKAGTVDRRRGGVQSPHAPDRACGRVGADRSRMIAC
jgi:hypothetical protein